MHIADFATGVYNAELTLTYPKPGWTVQTQLSYPTLSKRPKLRQRRSLQAFPATLFMAIAIYSLINIVSGRYVVDGRSMYPTFDTDQVVYVSRLHYFFGKPSYQDIVVFHYPYQENVDYIKRIIGLPGDTVEFRNTQLFVNGHRIEEPYVPEACHAHICPDRRWQLSPDEYFIMGDNRNHSSDSRVFGPVHRRYLIGAAVFRYWPLDSFGDITRIGA
jgi:signal peptidase I